jgi:hypothetical protein
MANNEGGGACVASFLIIVESEPVLGTTTREKTKQVEHPAGVIWHTRISLLDLGANEAGTKESYTRYTPTRPNVYLFFSRS